MIPAMIRDSIHRQSPPSTSYFYPGQQIVECKNEKKSSNIFTCFIYTLFLKPVRRFIVLLFVNMQQHSKQCNDHAVVLAVTPHQ